MQCIKTLLRLAERTLASVCSRSLHLAVRQNCNLSGVLPFVCRDLDPVSTPRRFGTLQLCNQLLRVRLRLL